MATKDKSQQFHIIMLNNIKIFSLMIKYKVSSQDQIKIMSLLY